MSGRRLVGGAQLGVRQFSPLLGEEGCVDVLWQLVARWRVILVEGVGHAVRKVGANKLGDVLFLLEEYAVGIGRDVDVQQIRDESLVLHIPSRGEVRGEGCVKRSGRVVRVEDEEVVD
eukprot:4985407-Pleurochrysis_carterae.AAC.1